MPSCQELDKILLNKFPCKWFLSKILLIKVVLLIQYSDKKIIFRKIKLIFDLLNWHWKLKMSNFWQSSIKSSYKISKNPLGGLCKCKNLVNLTFITNKFQHCHHPTACIPTEFNQTVRSNRKRNSIRLLTTEKG